MNLHLGMVLDQYIEAVKVQEAQEEKKKPIVKLNDVLSEYILKKKSDYENFMDPEVIKRYND
jgi:hypothetical protein